MKVFLLYFNSIKIFEVYKRRKFYTVLPYKVFILWTSKIESIHFEV